MRRGALSPPRAWLIVHLSNVMRPHTGKLTGRRHFTFNRTDWCWCHVNILRGILRIRQESGMTCEAAWSLTTWLHEIRLHVIWFCPWSSPSIARKLVCWPNPGAGRLHLHSCRRDVELAGVLVYVASVSVSCVSGCIFCKAIEQNKITKMPKQCRANSREQCVCRSDQKCNSSTLRAKPQKNVLSSAKFRADTKFHEITKLYVFRWCVFRNVFSPKGWHRNLPKLTNPIVFGSYRLHNGFTHFRMQVRCEKTLRRHLDTSPDLFWKEPGPENRV